MDNEWNEEWPERRFIERIHLRLVNVYGSKFNRPCDENWVRTWAEVLNGVSVEQMKHGLNLAYSRHPDWPPTAAQFRDCCKSMVESPEPLPEVPRHKSEHAESCIARIKEIMASPKPDPRAWRREIMDKIHRGEAISHAASRMVLTRFPEEEYDPT